MRALLALIILTALAATCLAGEIRTGAAMRVKANAIWFQYAEKFARWQALKKSGDAKTFAAFQEQSLHQRDAWQFTRPQAVTILGFAPALNRVDVEMTTEGRLQGSRWMIDPDAIEATRR